MEQKKKILFIINSISRDKKKSDFYKTVLEALDMERFYPTFKLTAKAQDAYNMAKDAVEANFDAVIAVGGDGTINEIGTALINTGVPLGIIPEGSGNGLALYLGIP